MDGRIMHRTLDFGAGPIEVFNTTLAAMRWAKRHKQDCKILAREKFYFQRKDGFEMTVRLNATQQPDTMHIFEAANMIADEIERMIEKEAAGNG